MMRRLAIAPVIVLLLPCATAAEDRFIGTLAGATFRTETGVVDLEQGADRIGRTIAASVGWVSSRWLGWEAEVTLQPGPLDGEGGLVSSSRSLSANGNVLVALPLARSPRIRPYGTLGAGVISIRLRDVADVFTASTTLAALNGGGGLITHLTPRVAIRGDLRYFRTTFRDPPPGRVAIGSWFVHYWRASAGLLVRF